MSYASALRNRVCRLLNSRIRITGDSDNSYRKVFLGRFAWMRLDNIKVSLRVLDVILSKRSLSKEFSVTNDKRLAIIIPFRDRHKHLERLLPCLEAKLQSEEINYKIIVAEQCDAKPFNKGLLFNAAVHEEGSNFDYFCLHDVDLLPLDCSYGCPSSPLRLFSVIETDLGNRQTSSICFGGVISLSKADYIKANGFSNNFWHWGKEDDNFLIRILLSGITPVIDLQGRFCELPDSTSRYGPANGSPSKLKSYIFKNKRYHYKLCRGLIDISNDGYSTANYELLGKEKRENYLWLGFLL